MSIVMDKFLLMNNSDMHSKRLSRL